MKAHIKTLLAIVCLAAEVAGAQTITPPANVTVTTLQEKDPFFTGTATASGGVAPLTITYLDDLSGLTNCNWTGNLIRTWTVTDADNNTSSAAQTITVVDTNGDIFLSMPVNVGMAVVPGASTADATFPAATAAEMAYFQGFEDPAFESDTTYQSVDWNNYYSEVRRVTSGTGGVPASSGNAFAIVDSSTAVLGAYFTNHGGTGPFVPYTNSGAFTQLGGLASWAYGAYGYTGDNDTPFGLGYRVALDVYINTNDPAIQSATPTSGYSFDLDTAASDHDQVYLRDFVFHVASYGPGNVVVAADNNSFDGPIPRRNDLLTLADHATLTNSGWFTFEWIFRDNGSGALAVDLNVRDTNGNLEFTETLSNPSDVTSEVDRHPIFTWFNFIAVDQLPIDNSVFEPYEAATPNMASVSSFPLGVTTVTETTTDPCGETSNGTFTVTAASTTNVYVDASYPASLYSAVTFPNTGGTGTYYVGLNAFSTIQAAVDAVAPGGTVTVAPGTYSESFDITNSLTLTSSGGSSVTTNILEYSNPATYLGAITIDASSVSISGFTVAGHDAVGIYDGDHDYGQASTDFILGAGATNVDIGNNVIEVGSFGSLSDGDDGNGILTTYGTSPPFSENICLHGNAFQPVDAAPVGDTNGEAFVVNPGTGNFAFTNNVIMNLGASGVQATNALIAGNIASGTGPGGSGGFFTWGYPDPTVWGHALFQANTITNCGMGIALYDSEDVVIEQNLLSRNGDGVYEADTSQVTYNQGTTVQILENNLANNTSAGLDNETATGTPNAASNWWGDISGPTVSSNPFGEGSVLAGRATYWPWQGSGANTGLGVGFEPSSGIVENPPAQLVFSTEPVGSTNAPGALSTELVVSVEDSNGNLTSWANPAITLAIGSNPGGGTLTGTNPKNATGGIAMFTDMGIGGKGGIGYTLTASAAFLTQATSTPFTILDLVMGTQPVSQIVTAGSNVVMSVAANSSGPLTYQWYYSNSVSHLFGALFGESSAGLTLAHVTQANDGYYYAVAANTYGSSATSQLARLTVVIPVGVSVQPASLSLVSNSTAVFTVGALGTSPAYQWYKNGGALANSATVSGVSTASLTIQQAGDADDASYDVVLTNFTTSITSDVATLTVIDAPHVTSNPASQSNDPTGRSMFAATFGGSSARYQWHYNNAILTGRAGITGITTPTLTISSIGTNEAGSYFVVATNLAGAATSTVATLTIYTPVSFTKRPANAIVVAGNIATFSVTATGTAPLGYTWYDGATALSDGANIIGSATSSLTLTDVQAGDAGTYNCVLSNIAYTVSSNPASLLVSASAMLTVKADTTRPSVTISSPVANATLTNGTSVTLSNGVPFTAPQAVITGTAADNGLVTIVMVQRVFPALQPPISAGLFGTKPGSKTFTNAVTFADGTNTFQVWATDSAGNNSVTNKRSFFLRDLLTVTLLTNGNGMVEAVSGPAGAGTPANGALLVSTYSYTIKAMPGSGYLFTNWSGSASSSSNPLTFVMGAGETITANFVTNPFVASGVVGTYNGLFYENTGITPVSSGLLESLTLQPSGAYSGTIVIRGIGYTASGAFDINGNSTIRISRAAQSFSTLILAMHVDLSIPSSLQITGWVADGSGAWTSPLVADLATNCLNIPAGRYTMLVPAASGAPSSSPGGFGYAQITNNAAGLVTASGAMSDGFAFNRTEPLSKDGHFPLYYFDRLTATAPWMLVEGWLDFSGANAPSGAVTWVKGTAVAAGTLYPGGYTNVINVLGSPYTPPQAGFPIILLSDGTLSIADANAGSTLTYNVGLSSNYEIAKSSGTNPTNQLTTGSSINPTTGVMTLGFRPTGLSANKMGVGAVLQNQDSGGGAWKAFDNTVEEIDLQ